MTLSLWKRESCVGVCMLKEAMFASADFARLMKLARQIFDKDLNQNYVVRFTI